MAKDILFGAQFTESKLGKTGLTVTFTVYRQTIADMTVSALTTSGTGVEVGKGLYTYKQTNADLQTYYYWAVAVTSTTSVDSREIPAVQLDWVDRSAKVPATLAAADVSGNLPAAVSDKTGFSLTSAERTAIRTELEGAGTTLATLLARVPGTIATLAQLTAQIDALNQSASRRILTACVGQMERPETGSNAFTIEVRTFDPDGAPVNATATPTIAPVGSISGSLAVNLGAVSNPATGVYRASYTVAAAHVLQEVRFDVSATLSDGAFTISTFSQVVDFVAATFTTTDRSDIQAAKAAALAAQTRAELALPSAVPGNSAGLPRVQDLPAAPDNAGITSISTALTALSGKFAGITLVANWLRALARKSTADATALSEINAGGGAYSATTDSLEAQADATVGSSVPLLLRGPFEIYLDGPESAFLTGDTLFVGDQPTLLLRVRDREQRAISLPSEVNAKLTRLDTGELVGTEIACTLRDAALGLVSYPVPSAATEATLAGKRLRLTLSWVSASRTAIAGSLILEVRAR